MRRWPLYLVAYAILAADVVALDLRDVREGRLPAAYAPYVVPAVGPHR